MSKIIDKKKTFIIAEAGIGHFGSFKIAKKLVLLAKKSGADAVKFQAYKTEDLIDKNFKEWFKRYKIKEVDLSFYIKVKNFCNKQKIVFLLTPHTESVLDWMKILKIPIVKIGSGEIGNFEFLKKVMKLNKTMIVSTGMHSKEDLTNLKSFFQKNKFNKVIFLKCNTTYPSKDENINLKNFLEFKKIFKNYSIGYSDHTNHDLAIIGSVFYGAKVVEKHISVLFKIKNAQDWRVSFDLDKMRELVSKIRKIESIMGNQNIFSTNAEKKSKIWASKSLYTNKIIPKNKSIKKTDLIFLRPGNGIPVKFINKILNKPVKYRLENNKKISFNDFKKK